jgi:hypothetical protein
LYILLVSHSDLSAGKIEYSFNEYMDMYMIFGEHCGMANNAARLYAEHYPEQQQPDRKLFLQLD